MYKIYVAHVTHGTVSTFEFKSQERNVAYQTSQSTGTKCARILYEWLYDLQTQLLPPPKCHVLRALYLKVVKMSSPQGASLHEGGGFGRRT